ncbi:MAG: GNAT family N-acetyltransferase, partial [Gemmatimonadota bacterium]|nr:GNAT family N-acetyltransferase [Gemmatimonadota bacterium]
MSAYVDPAAHRLGVRRALYRSLFAVLRLQGFQSAYAGIALPNPASIAFHEPMGFMQAGTYHRVGYKHGEWPDVRWYERSLGDHPGEPPVPRPPSGGRAGAGVRSGAGERYRVSGTLSAGGAGAP